MSSPWFYFLLESTKEEEKDDHERRLMNQEDLQNGKSTYFYRERYLKLLKKSYRFCEKSGNDAIVGGRELLLNASL